MIKKAVVIGGSAGSVVLIYQLIKQLREDFPHPIFIVIHRLSEKKSNMGILFQSQTKITVIEPTGDTKIKNNTIYLAPPNRHLYIEDKETVGVDDSPLIQFSKPSIDVLFFSASEIFKSKLIGIIVTGTNRDGAAGMHRIKENGGITIVQDPKDAQLTRMPQAALEITKIDHLLTGDEIIKFVNNIV